MYTELIVQCMLIHILLGVHLVLCNRMLNRSNVCLRVCVHPLITSVVKQAAADVAAINIKIKQLHEQIS